MLALPKLSIVITVVDSSHRVASVIDEASRALTHATLLEFIIIDDATDDGNARGLTALAERDARIRLIRHAQPIGADAALCQASDVARGDWIVTFDAYGRDDPHDLPDMLCDAQQHGLTLVEGIPSAPLCRWRRLTHRVARALGIDPSDSPKCGLRLVRTEALTALPSVERLQRFLPLLVRRGGGLIGSYRVNARRVDQAPSVALWRRPLHALEDARDFLGMWWLSRRLRPARRARTGALAR